MKKLIITFSLVALISIAYFSGVFDRTPTIEIPDGSSIYFTNSYPDEDDENVVVCVPAAYTSEDGDIIGHYSIGGKRKGNTNYGYTTIHLDRGTHFQQASLVKNHVPKSFSDQKHRFRRALCKKSGRYYIVHSNYPITLTSFANQLKDYDRAWNLDMGTYAYGWYRNENGKQRLGFSAIWNKHKQSNWIVCRKD